MVYTVQTKKLSWISVWQKYIFLKNNLNKRKEKKENMIIIINLITYV